ncbi:hypothetical protein EG328_005708 [Venturia inaequalis]|uniref:C3H1-type domain-containing protein n=1 Tax=Venturia inaequalis TaxID=5025 RepID=A0A8H3YVH1_VENIN|nr:hypothetical protein EG328_005708 [Venturia inaequalis]
MNPPTLSAQVERWDGQPDWPYLLSRNFCVGYVRDGECPCKATPCLLRHNMPDDLTLSLALLPQPPRWYRLSRLLKNSQYLGESIPEVTLAPITREDYQTLYKPLVDFALCEIILKDPSVVNIEWNHCMREHIRAKLVRDFATSTFQDGLIQEPWSIIVDEMLSFGQWTANTPSIEPDDSSPSESSTTLMTAEPEDLSPSKDEAIPMTYPTQFGFNTPVRGAAQFYTWFGFHLSPGESSRKRQRSMLEVDSGRPEKRARIFIDNATEFFIANATESFIANATRSFIANATESIIAYDLAISEQPRYLEGLHLGEALYRDAHQ